MQGRTWTNREWTHRQRWVQNFRSLYLNTCTIFLLCNCLERAVIQGCLLASELIVPGCFHRAGTEHSRTCTTEVITGRMVRSGYLPPPKRALDMSGMIFMLCSFPEMKQIEDWVSWGDRDPGFCASAGTPRLQALCLATFLSLTSIQGKYRISALSTSK